MNNKKLIMMGLILLLVFAASYFAYGFLTKNYEDTPTESTDEDKEIIPAPDFTLETLDGNEVSLSDFKGKNVVLNFWATWCGYCVQEMPDFNEVAKEYKDKNVEFLMINCTIGGETKEVAEKFLKDNNLEFENVLLDKDGKASVAYNASGLPTTYFIDKNSNIYYGGSGMMIKSTLTSILDSMIEDVK